MDPTVLYPLAAGFAAILILRLPVRLVLAALVMLAGAAALPVLLTSLIR